MLKSNSDKTKDYKAQILEKIGQTRIENMSSALDEIYRMRDMAQRFSVAGDDYRINSLNGNATALEKWSLEEQCFQQVFDFAMIAQINGENGANIFSRAISCPFPASKRAILEFSHCGSELSRFVEFDFATLCIISDFDIPAGYTHVQWSSQDTLYVGHRDQNDCQLRYPITVRELHRRVPFSQNPVVYEGHHDDLSVTILAERCCLWRDIAKRWVSTYGNLYFCRTNLGDMFLKIPLPELADVEFHLNFAAVHLLADTAIDGLGTVRAGTLLLYQFSDSRLQTLSSLVVLANAQSDMNILSFCFFKGGILWIEDNLFKSRFLFRSFDNINVTRVLFEDEKVGLTLLPQDDVAAQYGEMIFMTAERFLSPPSCYQITKGGECCETGSSFAPVDPPMEEFVHEIQSTISADGEIVYYHLIRPDIKTPVPALLYGYGGFNISLKPFFLDDIGKLWLSKGYAFVIPLVRGGGERGLAWQIAGRNIGRLAAIDDFCAVAKHLITTGISVKGKMFAWGESNGGLLAINAMLQTPDIFGGVWCAHPVLDLTNYTQFGQGSVWVDEYGDPSDPHNHLYLKKLSPIYNIKSATHYPPSLFTGGKTDERVNIDDMERLVETLQSTGAQSYFSCADIGGHSSAKSKSSEWLEEALGFAFLHACLNNQNINQSH